MSCAGMPLAVSTVEFQKKANVYRRLWEKPRFYYFNLGYFWALFWKTAIENYTILDYAYYGTKQSCIL